MGERVSLPPVEAPDTPLGDLAAFIAGLPIGVYVCDAPGGRIRFHNEPMVRLWGRAPEPGDDHERAWAGRLRGPDGSPLPLSGTPMAEALRDGRPCTGELVVLRPDGSEAVARVTASPLHDAEGRMVGTVNAFSANDPRPADRDAIDQRREEDIGRLAAIVTGADDAIVSKTLEGVITSWNPAAEAMFGHTAAEAVGRSITLIIPPDRLDEERDILSRLRRGQSIDHFETQRITKDGRLISVSLSISPVRDSRGRVIGASKILRDMTERLQVEARLKATVQTLEILYRLADLIGRARTRTEVCQAAVQGILSVASADRASVLVFDEEGVMRFVASVGLSDRYRAATEGHSPWTRGTKNPPPVLVEDARAAPELGELREAVLGEGIRALGFFPLVHQEQLLGKFMLYHDAPHAFSPDELRLAATAAQHISMGLARADSEAAVDRLLHREKAAREEAEAARRAAVRANRDKDEFLAMLAHELRNPVGVIVNAVSLIDGGQDRGQVPSRAAAMIRRQARHLARLLDDLLDVARITRGRIQMDRQPVELGEALDLAAESQRHQLEARGQRLVVERPDEGVVVLGDPVRLQQVFGNLLNNASKYSPPDASIRVRLAALSQEAVVTVSDQGAGIPPDQIDSIFELFAQANPGLARTQGGLGIGLTLVKRIVELHGGTVQARSEGPGRGAEFTVRLPAAAAPAAIATAASGAGLSATPRRVLVIEDHPDGREALAFNLARYGHEVATAATGQEGIDRALEAPPHIALVDIGLPDVDGYEVARRLRRQLGGRIRLVALTGYGQPEDRAQATAAGFDTHLVKPIDPDELAQVIESLSQAAGA